MIGRGTLAVEDGNWSIEAPPYVMIALKRLFRSAKSQYGRVRLSITDESARDIVWFCSRHPLEMDEATARVLDSRAARYDERMRRVQDMLSGAYTPGARDLAIPLRDYQRVAVDMALQSRGLLLADDVGLGKTAVPIGMATDSSTLPMLVVCETHLARQFGREFARFAPGLRVHVVTKGTPYDVGARWRHHGRIGWVGHGLRGNYVVDQHHPDVLILSYSKLAKWADVLAPTMRSVVWDEAQALRRGTLSQRGTAAYHVADNVTYRIGLTASPIYNYGEEIWYVMRGIAPGYLGTKAEFCAEWCHAKVVAEPRALGSYLQDHGLMLRRRRADVGRELPALHRCPVAVDIDERLLRESKDDLMRMARAIMDGGGDAFKVGGELSARVRHATGVGKATFVATFVRLLLQQDVKRKVLVGVWHRDVYAILKKFLGRFGVVQYSGSESPAAKDRAASRFKDGDARVMLLSLRSGAGLDGLQYSGCTHVVYAELDYSPEVHRQFTGRIRRDGQEQQVVEYLLHAMSGSDPIVLDILTRKKPQAQGIVNPGGETFEGTVDVNRAKRLAEAVLAGEVV